MYYSKQNSTNSDYYNTYNSNSYQYDSGKGYLTLILKILLIALLIGVLFVGYLFVINEAKLASSKSKGIDNSYQFAIYEDMTPEVKVKEESIESESDCMSQEDIARVVQIVISKLNRKEDEQIVDDEHYTKELLSQAIDGLTDSFKDINFDNLDAKRVVKQNIDSKDVDYYNKVVINKPKDETYTNDRLAQLSSELSSAIESDSNISNSSYTDTIIKEIVVRSNEMRIIIVQKGDTLSKIAHRAYGDYDSYVKIFEANPEVLVNPDQIFVGQRLRIPL